MDPQTIGWIIAGTVLIGCAVALTIGWHRYGMRPAFWKKKHTPESTPASRDLAQEELARLREIGGNGQHKKAS